MKSKIWRIFLSLVLPVCSWVITAAPALADDTVQLVIGGEGSTDWVIGNVKPGDTGQKIVTLQNTGTERGIVTIWVSDIIQGEGLNPEPETGNLSDPGELGNFLFFSCSCGSLLTNLSKPVTVTGLPSGKNSLLFMYVYPLDAKETVTLAWSWEFRESDDDESQNDAMGDVLSFAINYFLERPLSTPDEPEKPGELVIDLLGRSSDVNVSHDGALSETAVASSLDDVCMLLLGRGTRITGLDGRPVTRIEIRKYGGTLLPPDGAVLVGSAYEVVGYYEDVAVKSISIDPPVKLTIRYAPEWLPPNMSTFEIQQYAADNGWTCCKKGSAYSGFGDNSALISHGGVFALIAELEIKDSVEMLPPVTGITIPDDPEIVDATDVAAIEKELSASVGPPCYDVVAGIIAGLCCLIVVLLIAIRRRRITKRPPTD